MAAYRFLIAQCGASVLHCCCLQQFPWSSPPPKNASILDSQKIPSVCVFFLLICQKPRTHASLSHNHHKSEQKIQSTGRELVYQQLLARQPPWWPNILEPDVQKQTPGMSQFADRFRCKAKQQLHNDSITSHSIMQWRTQSSTDGFMSLTEMRIPFTPSHALVCPGCI
jgi:hypothetical protein